MTIKDLKAKLLERIDRLNQPEFHELPEIPHQLAEISWILNEVDKIIENA